MKWKLLLGAFVVATAVSAQAAPAMAWDLLGTRTVSDRAESDTFVLPGNRRYSQIRLCVSRNPVRFYDLDVRFDNGGNQDVSIRSRINAGQCTRAIDLNGRRRDIRSVRMIYEETSGRRARAVVRLYGR